MKSVPLALASIGVAALAYALAMLVTRGTFSSWTGGCGDFGMRCVGQGVIVLGVGCLAGALLALVSLGHADARTRLGWVALLMNGLPLAAIGLTALLIGLR
ncbi:hypothetical protein HF313_20925 [Massilia atriviolacea]|uniref:Transmembrane protein n=1 Tax=Massilia atriviolacea TaxID=2495579 RepID=A0A430HRY0_9BURK|nr:hypothetical protein [Massilia atriviolacea]RSZ60252.1 hypothetical protein EJB06_03765 [Massilia atriviolacea]